MVAERIGLRRRGQEKMRAGSLLTNSNARALLRRMDPFALVAGISLEQYAELCAVVALYEGNAEPPAELLHDKGVSLDTWNAARTGWTTRLEDPSTAAMLSMTFVPAYYAALDRVHGPAPTLSFEAYIALVAEVQQHGFLATMGRLGLARHRYAQIAFSWNVAFSRDPQQFVAYVCLLHIEIARLVRGEASRPFPELGEVLPVHAESPDTFQSIEHAVPTPPALPITTPAPVVTPPAIVAPAPVQPAKSIEQEATEAANAVGSVLKNGFNKLGGALDAFGKSLNKPTAGSQVLVTWSDGNKYPGMVADIGQGQYLVTMSDGRQVWVPEAYVGSNA